MKKVGKYVENYLNNFQFGVGVSDGVGFILDSANKILRGIHI